MAGRGSPTRIGSVNPSEAWDRLGQGRDSALVDVRTWAEWNFVGIPDLTGLDKAPVCVEWAVYPDMSNNPRFVAALMEEFGGSAPSELYFICRSGARSLRAAEAVASHLSEIGQEAACFNVAEGFEGDLDPMGHRGGLNGWKARGLAWRQS
jgi:rhodanese-related sulfurtransferase